MSAVGRIGASALDRVVFGRAPEKSYDDMSVEELEAGFRIKHERRTLAELGGFAGGLLGGAWGGLKLAALAAL